MSKESGRNTHESVGAGNEIRDLTDRIDRLERDNRRLAAMNEDARRLIRSYEEEKRRQSLFAELLMQSCKSMLFLFDAELRLVDCSGACVPLLSQDGKEELINRPFSRVFTERIDREWSQKVMEQNRNAINNRESVSYDDTILFDGKNIMNVYVSVSPVVDGENVSGSLMSIDDVTELVQTGLKAEAAARSKSSFLANMSHEIRTPMNAVKGLSELLAMTELNDLQHNYVRNIVTSSNSLLSIINDILDFSKIDANKFEFIEGPYNLAELITGVCNVVNYRAGEKDVLMFIEISPDMPVGLYGDDLRVKQVLTNIISNAVKYTDRGHVILEVHMERRGEKDCLVFSVEDTGAGIREEEQASLFDAFSRADLLLSRSVSGTGLGLAIAKHLTVAMGGDICVKSVYGEGSTFTFWIPQRVVNDAPIARVENPAEKKVLLFESGKRREHIKSSLSQLGVDCVLAKSEEDLGALELTEFTHCIFDDELPGRTLENLREGMPQCRFALVKDMRYAMAIESRQDRILYLPLFITEIADFLNESEQSRRMDCFVAVEELTVRDTTVLLVDDNEINLLVGSEMLRSFKAEVVLAESGFEAIERCDEQKFDLIFMDHMMPEMDGVEATKQLREKRGPNWKTPIIALTANVVNDMRSYYLRCGMDDFVPKPVELAELGRVLGTWLPSEKVIGDIAPSIVSEGASQAPNTVSTKQLIEAMDSFGLYSSDVMRELNGNFEVYIRRMELAQYRLGSLVESLKTEVSEERWDDFTKGALALRELLYSIGARDCAARARKLALAARNRNIAYIYEDFFSLMGNMYMLDKKLVVLVPVARGGDLEELPLNVPQYLHACLDKMGRALRNNDAVDTMMQLENAAAFSLDMDLDMALKQIKIDLESGDFDSARKHHTEIFRNYSERYNIDFDSAV